MKSSASVQELLGVEAREGILYTARGMAAIVEVTPVDLSLEPMDVYIEVEEAFRSYLVGLTEPVQIFIRKARYSVDDYLRYLTAQLEREATSRGTNINLLELGHEFTNFIFRQNREFEYFRTYYYLILWSEEGASVTPTATKIPFLGNLMRSPAAKRTAKGGNSAEAARLRQRGINAISSLRRSQLDGRLLSNDGIIQLLYGCLNPDAFGNPATIGGDYLGPLSTGGES